MKKYQIKKLVNKITKSTFNLNSSFNYYGYNINCTCNTIDIAVVDIDPYNRFTFDFWTKELNVSSIDTSMKTELINAFKEYYDIIVKNK